jgi:hypothetical protein
VNTVPCADCGTPRPTSIGSLPEGQLRCHACRRANPAAERRRDAPRRSYTPNGLPCSDCGETMWSKTPPRNGKPRCLACRRARPVRGREVACAYCGVQFRTSSHRAKFCSQSCFARFDGDRRRVSTLDDPHYRRSMRERSAPGLNSYARKMLATKWRNQGRACVYCGELATTIDHVLPLVRGGTNHEGNLAPCCKRCNSSKAGWTVVEWRSGLRLPPMREALPWTFVAPSRIAPKLPKPPRPTRPCCICGTLTTNRLTCSKDCGLERNNRMTRDRYRASVGLPVDPDEPSSFWKRRLDVAC